VVLTSVRKIADRVALISVEPFPSKKRGAMGLLELHRSGEGTRTFHVSGTYQNPNYMRIEHNSTFDLRVPERRSE
jgi:hypothetical protein